MHMPLLTLYTMYERTAELKGDRWGRLIFVFIVLQG